MFEGTNLDVESYNGVVIEFKEVSGKNASTTANGIVSLRFRRAGNGNPNSGFGSKSNTRSFTCGAYWFDNANSFAFMGVPAVAMTLVGASGVAELAENPATNGIHLSNISASSFLTTDEPSAYFSSRSEYIASFGNNAVRLPELWLNVIDPDVSVPFTATYRIIRKW